MYRKYMRRGMMVALAIIAGIFLLSPGLTFAGVQGGAGPTVTSPVKVGQTGLDWFLDITNTSTSPNDVNKIKVTNIFVTTACGEQTGGGTCPAGLPPVGKEEANKTIEIFPLTARAGEKACATVNFTVVKTGNNEYQFIPDSDVLLAPTSPPGNENITCRIPFKVNINAGVAIDAVPPDPPKNTAQLGRAAFLDVFTGDPGTGTGSSNVVVNLCKPTIVTIPDPASSTIPPTPAVLKDRAKLTKDPDCPNVPVTGGITFNLYGVNDPSCASAAICTDSATVDSTCFSSTGCPTPTGCSVIQAGVYHWIATYSGDISNEKVPSICGNEAVPVLKITTTQNPPSACAGADLNDSAKLEGGNNPKGSITFKLYGTNNCSGSVICTRGPVPVTDNGTFSTPTPCNVAAEGTYYWQACYNSTDGINPSVCSACDAEPVVIEKIPVEISTTANPTRGCVGATLKDSAKLSGGCNPKGSITFTLYDAGDTSCTGPKIFTEDVPVDHVPPSPWTYSTSGGWPTVKAGTYRWIACYTSSDANNDSKCTNCNDPGEVVVIEECQQGGESPYIAIVGNDIDFNPFYFSEKHQQFLFDQEALLVHVCFGTIPPASSQTRVPVPPAQIAGCEQFRSNKPINQPEICDKEGKVNDYWEGDFEFRGESNAVITKQSTGYFEWWIRLPKRPNGEINICIQCGILKPNTFTPYGFGAVELCAAETGERIGRGICTRNQVAAGVNPIVNTALPKITAWAYPGPYANEIWKEFRLTAYKNPGTYRLSDSSTDEDPAPPVPRMTDSAALQVLDGSAAARVLLKSCMDKCVIAKIPVTGQVNARGETEHDLEAGDLIKVRLDIPNNNTVDIYCHSQSTKIMGIGVPE